MTQLNFETFTRLCDMLKELYGLESVADLRSIDGGFTTENFLFSDTEQTYFLKRYNTIDTQRIHDINASYSRFSEGGIPVITPMKNAQQEVSFFLDNAWWGVFPFVDGITKSSNDLTLQDVANLGSFLAQLHMVGRACPREDIQPIALWNKNVFISDKHALEYRFAHETNQREVDWIALENIRIQERFLNEHKDFLGTLKPQNDCLIHGDFTHNNVFFHQDGRVKATFDLDKTCVAPRAYELARSTLITCFDHTWDETSYSLAHRFMSGYLEILPMSQEEFRLGLNMYIANYMHMTWLEKKVVLYRSKRHETILRSSHIRLKHLADEFLTLADRLYQAK